MKTLDSSARFAIGFFLVVAVIIAGFGFYDRAVSGSAPLVFPAAGVSVLLAIIVYVASVRSKGPGATPLLLLPLLLAGAAGCARPGGPNAEQVAETRTAQRADTVWAVYTQTENGWDATRAR